MKFIRCAALLVAASLIMGVLAMTVGAEEQPEIKEVLVEEGFDDYDIDWEAQNTLLPSVFTIEANSIGDGYVRVQEHPLTGYLNLKSHVFTQIYNTTPIEGPYVFSLDIVQVQGKYDYGLFLRAPIVSGVAYYEKDGYESNSCCRTGVVLYFRQDSLEVNIKAYDTKLQDTNMIAHNIYSFPYPEGVEFKSLEKSVNFKVVDTGSVMQLYIEDTLMCRIELSDPGDRGYARVNVTEPCYKLAKIFDAEGTELGTVERPLIQAKGSTVGWATRVSDMIVDTVYLATLVAPETEPVTEPVTDPATETEPETDPETTPDTDPVTDPASESATDAPTETPTEDAADTGCASALGGAAVLLMAAAAAVALRKKS